MVVATLWFILCLVGGTSRAAERVEPSTRLAQLEAVARAALLLRKPPSDLPSEVHLDDLHWGGPTGNVEVVSAEDLARLIRLPWGPQQEDFQFFARWPLEAAERIRGGHAATDLGPSVELLERLRYVIVVFERRYEREGFRAEDPSKRTGEFWGSAVLYSLDGAKALARSRFSAFNILERNIKVHLAAMVGRSSWPDYAPLMEFEPPPLKVVLRPLEIVLVAIAGLGALLLLLTLIGRRRHRLRRDLDGVRVQIGTSDDGSRVRLEVEARLGARITWSREPRDGDLMSGDGLVDRKVRVQGAALPALYAAMAGAPVWRPIVEMGGWVEGDRERLVVEMSPQLGVDANARRVAGLVRDLREVGDGIARLAALAARAETSRPTRMRIALALCRWAPESAEARSVMEEVGWAEPLEPHLIAGLEQPDDVLLVDVCDALATLGTEAAVVPLERVAGPARPAARQAIAAITARFGDSRRGGLELSSAEAGSLSLPDER